MNAMLTFPLRLAKAVLPNAVRRYASERRFFRSRGWRGLHYGVFADFASALSFAESRCRAVRYEIDHGRWLEQHTELATHDYPALYWLSRCMEPGARIFDWGGSVGVTFILFRRVHEFPEGVQWQVCELEQAVSAGVAFAARSGLSQLTFTSDAHMADGAQILFTAGAIQFIEQPLAALLGSYRQAPSHVIINRLPLTPRGHGFVTLQNTGVSIAPCRVANDAEFISELADLGYTLIDRWKCLENSMYVAMHSDLQLHHFHGFYFRRIEQS